MAVRRNLRESPDAGMARVLTNIARSAKQTKTGPAGVVDYGETGDAVWLRPDGTPVSVRDVDLELADARQRIEDAEGNLAESGARLTAAEQAVQDVRDELAAIEVGEGGPLIHSTPPSPADGEGKPAGTAWLVYGTDGTLTSVWQWDGTAWEEMPLDATLIPVLDIGSGTFGDLEGARLVVDNTLSARVVQAMSAEVKELVVTESAVLNHVTAIGQTVVDDINVQGKLVGKDGVFTGTVDFENVNVTGTQIVNKLGANSIDASKINGDTFTGNIFNGGTFNGAAFRGGTYATSNNPSITGGVMIDPTNGLRGWNSGGLQTFRLKTDDGTMEIGERMYFTEPATQDGIIIDPKSSANKATLYFARNRDTSRNSAAIWRGTYTIGKDPLYMRGANGAGVYIQNGLDVEGTIGASGGYIGGVGFNSDNKNTSIINGKFFYPNRSTTSAGANVYMSSSDEFAKITSSRRFKRNIIDWNPSVKSVLGLRPRRWQHNDPDNVGWVDERWHVGFIAEEVEEAGLRDLVVYNVDEKGDWVPEALSYDRFAAAQQVVLLDHEARIAELEEALNNLKESTAHGD